MRKGKIIYYACEDVSEYDLDDPKELSKFYEEVEEACSSLDNTDFSFFEQELYEVHYRNSAAKYIYAYSPAEAKLLAHLDSVHRNTELNVKDYTACPFLLKDAKGRDEIVGDMNLDKYRDMVYDAEEKEESNI